MSRAAPERPFPRPAQHAGGAFGRAWRWLAGLLALLLALGGGAARADGVELASFELERAEDGLVLGYAVNFELTRAVEEALAKSVPLTFVAEVAIYRDRWYWTDKRIARAQRMWRIVYQPLTATYRVTFGDLSQSYASRAEALASVRRALRWKIADAAQLEGGGSLYAEFSFRLDTSLLPRPMQIGIGGLPDWNLSVERTQRLP